MKQKRYKKKSNKKKPLFIPILLSPLLSHPHFLWLLLLIPLYIAALCAKHKMQRAIRVPALQQIRASQPTWSVHRCVPLVQHILICIIIALSAYLLARPLDAHQVTQTSKDGIDIMMTFDVSHSMLAEDLQPNRIEAAKKSLTKFINARNSDRIGVIVFAGEAFTQSPLTFDYTILKEYIEDTSTEIINQQVLGGTAIGDAMFAAMNRFDQEDRSKVIIVLTDGDSNVGPSPLLAAQKAYQENVKVYVIGIGTPEGAPMPTFDRFGNKTIARAPNGAVIMARYNEEGLKQIAQTGGGRYFRAGNNQQFEEVLNEIDTLEKRELETEEYTEYTERYDAYTFFLALALIFYLLLLTIRPSTQ